MDDLTFGDSLRYSKGSKKGRFYADAPIPPEHRALYNGRTQERISLGSDPNKVEVKRAIEIGKANKEHRNKIAAHDPLIDAAERLIEALVVEHDPAGKKLKVEDWYPRPLTTEELEGLRHYTIEESPAKTEYNRLLQALRNETFNLLYSEHNQITIPVGAISNEFEDTNLQLYLDEQSPRSVHWKPTGSFAAAKKELEAQGKTQKEIDEWFKLLYQTGLLNSTYDAWHRRDQINDAWVAFQDEHLAKTTGRAKSGKRYSDAIKSYAEQFQTGSGQIAKRNKTFDEYTSYQRYFVDFLSDLDLADITEEHGLRIVDDLERKGKSNGTIGKYFSGIRAALKRAKHDRWIKVDPFENLDLKGRGKSKVKRKNLTPAQIRQLFNLEMPEQVRMCLRLLLATGFRLEEGASLLWSDIKDEGGIQ
ncbi:MAG: phage integrase SAM-like domain-containing protein, partial [Rhodobacter sp.]